MNAGIVILQDGKTPCIAHDEPLPHPLKHIQFHKGDHTVTLVYDVRPPKGASKFSTPHPARTFDFPLERRFADLLMQRGNVAVACIKGEQLLDIKIFPVIVLPPRGP